MQSRTAFQILNGAGSGNIGDDLMMHAFWDRLPPDFQLHAGVFPNYVNQRQPYPSRFHYYPHHSGPMECAWVRDMPGLLSGTTSISDNESLGWPLGFLAPRMRHFREHGLPVDAVGIGVDFLVTAEGRKLFHGDFMQVRSWTVRDEAGRDALLDLGVEPARVAVGCDWAWLYQAPADFTAWAAEYWRSLGIDPGLPLLAVNLFWQGGDPLAIWTDIAAVLDSMHRDHGLQIAFFCNESRHPGFDRAAAESARDMMTAPSVLVPNEYFAPGEMIALLRHATVTLSQRYHAGVESVMAHTVPVLLGRGQKVPGLCRELGLTPCGSLAALQRDEVIAALTAAVRNRAAMVASLQTARAALTARARTNLQFLKLFSGLRGTV